MITTHELVQYIYPTRVCSFKNCVNCETLLSKKPLVHTFNETDLCELKAGGYIVLDFGAEYSGGARILTAYHAANNNEFPLRLRFGESLGEVMQELGEFGTTNDHSLRDFEVRLPMMSDQTYGSTGFRFLRIDNLCELSVTIKSIAASAKTNSAQEAGYFECDDEELNEIFKISNRTAHLCVQNGFLIDGIKRDRLVWCGDMNVQIRTLLDSFGDLDAIYDSLEASMYQTKLPNWMNGIPSYSLWWLLNVYELYVFNGGTWIKKFLPYIEALVFQIGDCVTEDGGINYSRFMPNGSENEYFIDWGTYGSPYREKALRYMTAYTLERVKFMLGDDIREKIGAIIKKIKLIPLPKNAPFELLALQAAYTGDLAYDADELPPQSSTFLSYFVYKTITASHGVNSALGSLKKYYGAMLKLGATTFFESFENDWAEGKIDEYGQGEKYFHQNFGNHCYKGYRLSLCHAWSSGPAPFLLEEVAGIRRINEKTYEIRPDEGCLKFIKGGCLTKYGLIEVEIRKQNNGKRSVRINHPKEISIRRG